MSSQLKVRIWNAKQLPKDWFKRAQAQGDESVESLENYVNTIIKEVRQRSDAALVKFTAKFDKAKINSGSMRVTRQEIQEAYSKVTKEQISALKLTKEKVAALETVILEHLGVTTSNEGITIQNMVFPIESVGCYIPGGNASYPSTVIMTTIPAKIAGVPRIVICSPPSEDGEVNPLVLVAADVCGVTEIYRVGGAQAIAALAYGTDSIKPVRKIVGPGNRYVTKAKTLVSKDVAIDMPAGPSEVIVLADRSANPKFVAADMISQAEHGADSVVGLITTSQKLLEEVLCWLRKMIGSTERRETIEKALEKNAFIIYCKTINEMLELTNAFAPEHLEIMIRDPLQIAGKTTQAGLILLGPNSPVSLTDYGSGTNHVLPTGGFAHTFSGLSVVDFCRRVSVVNCSKDGLMALKTHVKVLTEAERLPNHYRAVEARFEE